jgi:hypothetical protein
MEYKMKTMLVLILSALAFSPVVGATDLFGPTPAIPSIYSDGLTRLQVPNLTKAERTAFSQMEALQQLGEVYVQANGCSAVSGEVDVYSNSLGTGDLSVITAGGALTMIARESAFDSFRGSAVSVRAASGLIKNVNFSGVAGTYRFNKSGSIMEGDAAITVPNPTANNTPDNFTARVIKDFFVYKQVYQGVPRDFTLDWGLQVINKKGYPVSKWFQRSWSVKDNGIEGRTKFRKVRIAGGLACAITVDVKGYNNNEQFNEQGTFTIAPVTGLTNVR